MKATLAALLAATVALLGPGAAELRTDEAEARAWLDDFEVRAQEAYTQYANAAWIYNTNLTDHNLQGMLDASLQRADFQKEAAHNASLFDWKNFADADLKRQFSKIAIIGLASLEADKVERANGLRGEMQSIYSKGKVCRKNDPDDCLPLDPDLTQLLASSRDWDELLWAWEGWREQTGEKMRDMYAEFIAIHNEAAEKEGFEDAGEYWRSWYDTETFEADVASLWEQVKPMYQHLHAYVRRKLQTMYAGREFPTTGHIPAHILGNMWAQSWSSLYNDLVPFPGKESVDVTDTLKDLGYNATGLFLLSEEFFTSLGLEPMPDSFWEHSLIEKPEDRDVVCHASAWDFYNQKDFRIKQCTDITHDWLVTTHHEMGHVQYYLQYKDQPHVYRRGGNPGFHEAVGDVMSLSVNTPAHLHEIGLLPNVTDDAESSLNYLFMMALKKIAFLPFGYLIDQWRWLAVKPDIGVEEYTDLWWKLRCKHQGVSPPVQRDSSDFDPGAKYHIPGHVPYIRYFVSFILQFQFHQALCDVSGYEGPLHRCDIYKSKEAGTKLGNMLKLGSSKPWPEAMEQITGQRNMNASALIQYFQPLTDWLKEQNKGIDITWDEDCPEGSFYKDPSPQPDTSCTTVANITLIIASVSFWLGIL